MTCFNRRIRFVGDDDISSPKAGMSSTVIQTSLILSVCNWNASNDFSGAIAYHQAEENCGILEGGAEEDY